MTIWRKGRCKGVGGKELETGGREWERRRRGKRLESDKMTMEKENRENEKKEDGDDRGAKKGNKFEENEMKVN